MMSITIKDYYPNQHYLDVCHWVQNRTKRVNGKDGFALDRWETQFSPGRLHNRQSHIALFFLAGSLQGVVVGEGPKEFHLLRLNDEDFELRDTMLNWTIDHCNGLPFKIWVESQSADNHWLESRGFLKSEKDCCNHQMRLTDNIACPTLPSGFRMISMPMHDISWREKVAEIDNLCFPWAKATEQKIACLAEMPSYKEAFHKLILNPEEQVVAFSVLWQDSVNNLAVFEPVGTHPDFRQRGFAKAVMQQLIHDGFNEGIRHFGVGSYSEAARSTYLSVGFEAKHFSHAWLWACENGARQKTDSITADDSI